MFRKKAQTLLKKVLVEQQLKAQYIDTYNTFLHYFGNLSKAPVNKILFNIKQCYSYAPQKASFKYKALFNYLDILYICWKNNIALNEEHNQDKINLKNICISFKKNSIFNKINQTSQRKIQLIINRLGKQELINQFSELKI